MAKWMAVISPAKLLDENTHYPDLTCTQPQFLQEAEYLTNKLKKLSASDLAALMDTSLTIGEENKRRFGQWQTPFSHANAHPALLMFKGEVYRGLKAEEFSKQDLDFAQKHIRILSGLYGILRPMDWARPYRLMMGTPFAPNAKTKNLYAYWGTKISDAIAQDLDSKGCLINLASSEYTKAIDFKHLNRRVITVEFKERKGEKFSVVMTYAKNARGKMARFLVENRITKVDEIKSFNEDNYNFNAHLSSENNWVFTRG